MFGFTKAKAFLRDEAGAVTTEWAILTVAVVGLGTAAVTYVQNNEDGNPTARAEAQFDSYLGPSPNGNEAVVPGRHGDLDMAGYEPQTFSGGTYEDQLIPLMEGYDTAQILEDLPHLYNALKTELEGFNDPFWVGAWADGLAASMEVLNDRKVDGGPQFSKYVGTLQQLGYL